MDRKQATRLSKFLSLVLRHRPDEYGLHMDELGFVDFESLVDVIVAEDIAAETAEDDIREIVDGSDRRRFEVVDGKIRALYGHSSRVRLNYPGQEPPESLYHGVSIGAARGIAEAGIVPAGRAYVHLSSTAGEAESVGGRNTEHPVVIRVTTAGAVDAGIKFTQATDLIWLCPSVPAECCEIPDLPERPAEPEPERAPRPERTERPARTDRPATSAPAPRASGGVQVVQPDPQEGFKRRTKKKSGGRR